MTPPRNNTVAGMIRPVPMPPDSQTNRDLLAVMEGTSSGYWFLLGLALFFMHLKYEKFPLRILAVAPLPLAVILVVAVITEFRW